MTMQNKTFLADARFFSQYARPYIVEESAIAGYRHIGYGEGDLLLDIIKEGLVAKRIATAIVGIVDIVQQLQRSKSDPATSDRGTWGRRKAACRRAGEPVGRVAGGIGAKEVAC
jgi:hypothetical protein